jgi:hypothetical protein
MKLLIIICLLFGSISVQSAEIFGFFPYARIGSGIKIQEPDYVVLNNRKYDMDFGGNDSALLEFGLENGQWSFGIKHDSQWSSGWPFNSSEEYYKTELFIAVKFGGKP